jgi:hypothetical protein
MAKNITGKYDAQFKNLNHLCTCRCVAKLLTLTRKPNAIFDEYY